ncbi:MAG: N-acetyltransferase family protein [Dehalococcoidia bacterium]
MPVYPITRYPRTLQLRDGACLTARPMTAADRPALLRFFLHIPEAERFYLKDDVTSPKVIESWTAQLDYDRALPLLAMAGERVVADAVLIRRRGGSRAHAGEIRIVVDPEYRGRGLGAGLTRELIEIAYDADLKDVIFELVSGMQDEAIEAAHSMGAIPCGTVRGLVHDERGEDHDVTFLMLPLGKWWEWSRT